MKDLFKIGKCILALGVLTGSYLVTYQVRSFQPRLLESRVEGTERDDELECARLKSGLESFMKEVGKMPKFWRKNPANDIAIREMLKFYINEIEYKCALDYQNPNKTIYL